MAHTKRKRRTKHRGNAAGYVESRGRTGRKPRPDEIKAGTKSGGLADRARKPPTWSAALLKAIFGGVMLFVLMSVGIFGKDQSTAAMVSMCAAAMAFYVPIMYLTDRWTYSRYLQRQKKA